MALPKNIEKIKNLPTVFIIFGATGDLSRKKLFPSLFELFTTNLLPEKITILASSRSQYSNEEFAQIVKETVNPKDVTAWEKFISNLEFISSDVSENKNLDLISNRLLQIEKEAKTCVQRIIYLAISPSIYQKAFENIGKNKLNLGCRTHNNKARIVIEKPFGHNLASAQELNSVLIKYFEKEQIFRIDHFLGKETVQNILAFRFGNEIFEPIWNNQYIDNIQITFTENIGVEKRGSFYDETGALRDVVQNHLFQLLALVAMEAPKSLTHEHFRDKRLEIIKSIKTMNPKEVAKCTLRGQYEGYQSEENVNPNSNTETFALVKLFIENKRWHGVPFYIRTGKKIMGNVTSIIISFKEKGHEIYENFWAKPLPNHITIQIKPTEGIGLRLVAKKPGFETVLEPVDMEFCYRTSFENHQPDAYERLLMDVIFGDQTLFIGEVGESWKIIDPIVKTWQSGNPPLFTYKTGSWGPKEADKFIEQDGRKWLAPYLTICNI